ncbi:hypothetical protein I317_01913 [Kwoniella heveanensis CBS 569]|nr:hypothetical protein I317_01913 [Kwoniella heveanensis CBS 569]
MSAGPSSAFASSTSSPMRARFEAARQEFADYLPLTQRLQADLRDDAEELRAQEGWSNEVWAGVEEWIGDLDSVFRILRRNRYDENKTSHCLLTALNRRAELSLHMPIPSFPPYTDSPLFYILPLPDHTDRLGRPVAVLTVKEVLRDEDGGLDDLKEWAWRALEMVRRTLRDYWKAGVWSKEERQGEGGEGMVLIVDAAGASCRNMEVELLPTLLSVGHNNFPGMIEAVYVVNAGWTHRSMWGIIKRVLPRSALEKVAFLDTAQAVEEVFEFSKLPQAYGGTHPFIFSPSHNFIFTYYSHHTSYDTSFRSSQHPSSRCTSTTSIADIYYSAPNTPLLGHRGRSRRNSSSVNLANGSGWRYGSALRMTKSRELSADDLPISRTPSQSMLELPSLDVHKTTPLEETSESIEHEDDETPISFPRPSTRSSQRSTPTHSVTPARGGASAATRPSSSSVVQRIKSLSDFHLYLSPSRLANIDLLSDSDSEPDEDAHPKSTTPAGLPPPRRILKPALLESESDKDKGLAERRLRPPLRLLGVAGKGEGQACVRTYSDRLQAHHAKILQQYTGGSNGATASTPSRLRSTSTMPESSGFADGHAEEPDLKRIGDVDTTAVHTVYDSGRTTPSTPGGLEPPSLGSHYTYPSSSSSVAPTPDQRSTSDQAGPTYGEPIPVQAYDTSNPWFGYPVIRVPDSSGKGGSSLRPRYYRNRKRDLIKTLLFLFMLRLQSLRESIERLLRLGLAQISFFGLGYSGNSAGTRGAGGRQNGSSMIGPSEGLIQSAQARSNIHGHGSTQDGRVVQRFDKDWWWMIIGFFLLRGTWTRIVVEPLEALGFGGWGKEVLGW